ncbi:hypothetical protein V3C99_003381 [Haemonchus contortus]
MTSPSVKLVQMDRLLLPVTINFIRSKVVEGESFLIGNKKFRKVLCVGCVESCRCVRSIGALEYVISDPAADKSAADKISVLHVDESYDVSRPVEKFPRGTLVLVPGKLVRFKGAVAIQAYSIREILCQEEFECLQMEAFLALQYHTKNPSGHTPGRRSSTGSNLRRSSSSVTPTSSVVGKRIVSPVVVTISTPKRPISSVRPSSSSNIALRKGSGDSVQSDDKRSDLGNGSSTLRESESQDSFEDSVFLKSDDN